MKSYTKDFIEDWDTAKGLIRQSDASKLLRMTRQAIQSRINTGSLKQYEYECEGQKLVFVSLEDVKKLKIKMG